MLLIGTGMLPAQAGGRHPGPDHAGGTTLVWSRLTADRDAAQVVRSDDGGRTVRAVTAAVPGVYDMDPQLSPDGRTVLFERDLPDGTEIGVVGVDGKHARVLDLGCTGWCDDQAPTWDTDGRHFFVTRVLGPFDEAGNLASAVLRRVDLRTGASVRFSEPGIDGVFEDYRASVAPDGTIVFSRVRNPTVEGEQVDVAAFRMDRDGTHVRRLTPWALRGDHAQAPTARTGPGRGLVVFETYGTGGAPDGTVAAVATVPLDCRPLASCEKRIRYLTSPSASTPSFNPAFSPDGRRVVYVHVDEETGAGDLWTVRTRGGHAHRVTDSPLFDLRPDWGVRARR